LRARIAIFFGGALIWLAVSSRVAHGWIVSVPTIVLFAAAFVSALWGLVLRRTKDDIAGLTSDIADAAKSELADVAERVSSEILSARASLPGERVLIGVRFGRRTVTCGALYAPEATSNTVLVGERYRTLVAGRTREIDTQATADTRFGAAVDAILDVAREALAREPSARIESLGFGVPGLVDRHAKTLSRAMEGFPTTHVVEGVARRLCERAGAADLFGVRAQEDFEALSLLDNDVRCATRFLLARHRGQPGWEHFAAVHLGTGVGVGLVLDHRLHFGAHGWAGEMGHIDLGPAPALSLAVGSLSLPRTRCSCHYEGYHFESLVNYSGLAVLARSLDSHFYARLDAACRGDEPAHDLTRVVLPSLVGSEGTGPQRADSVRALIRSVEAREFLAALSEIYTTLVAGGISCLANLFDLERVVLFGSLYEQMHDLEFFDQRLRTMVNERLQFTRGIEYDYCNAQTDIWRGAALLGRDAEFEAFRTGTRSTSP
jgi:predicted NBD/HSP70 family sugar kinase